MNSTRLLGFLPPPPPSRQLLLLLFSSKTFGAVNVKVAPEILCQVVIKLMDQRGGSILSRELGRELNNIIIDEDGTKALSVIKEVCTNHECGEILNDARSSICCLPASV